MGTYAIGDVQGCYDELRALLDTIDFDPGRDRLWLTGDLVNRGPKSLKTLRVVRSLGDAAVTVIGHHDLHLLALGAGVIRYTRRFSTLRKTLRAADGEELLDWLRHRPLAHHDRRLDTLLVHAGTLPSWSVRKTLLRAAEVEQALQGEHYETLLAKMYGNTPARWSGSLRGYKRLRFIINCLTRMRMLTAAGDLDLSYSGVPWRRSKTLTPWYATAKNAWSGTRIVFGHWSQLGLIVLPRLVSLDTGCVWGRQLTAVRLDLPDTRVYQVAGRRY